MVDQDCNKISPTAIFSTYFRRDTGIGYAERLAQVSNAEAFTRRFVTPELFPQIGFIASTFEGKYRAIQKYIADRPDHNVLHLGCALLTHGLFVPEGVKYLGLDLPDMIETRRRIFADAGVQYPAGYRDQVCNILDREGLERAVRDFLPKDKRILVVHESLLYHFTLPEKKRLTETMASFGRDYGLTWANTDMAIKPDIIKLLDTYPALSELIMFIIDRTGRDLVANSYPSVDAAAEVLTSTGFKFNKEVDIHPLYTEGSFPVNTLPSEGKERQIALGILRSLNTWMAKFDPE